MRSALMRLHLRSLKSTLTLHDDDFVERGERERERAKAIGKQCEARGTGSDDDGNKIGKKN